MTQIKQINTYQWISLWALCTQLYSSEFGSCFTRILISFIAYTELCSVQFSHSIVSNSLQPHGLQHARPPCPSPTPGVYSNSCPLSRWCHPTISSSVLPFSSYLQFSKHHHQASLSFTVSQSLIKLMSIESWCHPTISFSVTPFSSCPQSFPALGSFPVSQLFESGGQSIEASASVLPVNIQGWSPLGLTGLISLQVKGLSRVFPSTTLRKHQLFSTQSSL